MDLGGSWQYRTVLYCDPFESGLDASKRHVGVSRLSRRKLLFTPRCAQVQSAHYPTFY